MATMVQPDPATGNASDDGRVNEITYRARRNKRLRICIKSNTGDQAYSRVTGLADPGMKESTNSDIGRAQAEMFDDEVFEMVGSLLTHRSLAHAVLRFGRLESRRRTLQR